jgi:hypothetical protein
VKISLSRNNGASWKDVGCLTESGRFEMDLAPHVRRLYDYRLRFELSGAGTELEALRIRNDVQHSQRALPALTEGLNTITFEAAPAEGTVTVEGCTRPSTRGGQVLAAEFNPELDGVESNQAGLVMTGRKGSVTFPVETPGDIVRLRLGAHYRARAASDGWDYLVSFDDGRTWAKVGRASGPVAGGCEYVTCASEVKAGSRRALVRFDGSQRNTTCIFDFRIDADYIEPKGGWRPVKITYVWEESGAEKRDVHVARLPSETYAIECRAKPLMKSITVELAE